MREGMRDDWVALSSRKALSTLHVARRADWPRYASPNGAGQGLLLAASFAPMNQYCEKRLELEKNTDI